MEEERPKEYAEEPWQCDPVLDGKALSLQTSGPANGERESNNGIGEGKRGLQAC